MTHKIALLRLECDPAYLYFVRAGQVWRVARQAGSGTDAERVASATAAANDPGFIYFLDRDGDLAGCVRPPTPAATDPGKPAPRRQRR